MPVHILDCIRRPASGAVSVRITLEVGLKYRFQHNLGGSLNHAVTDRRHGRIELHLDPVSFWDRLRLLIPSIPSVGRSLPS